MNFALLLLAVVLAGVIAAFRPRFGLFKPALGLFGCGFVGSVLFFIAATRQTSPDLTQGDVPLLGTFGALLCMIAVIGLLVLAVLYAHRRWSGFYKEHSP